MSNADELLQCVHPLVESLNEKPYYQTGHAYARSSQHLGHVGATAPIVLTLKGIPNPPYFRFPASEIDPQGESERAVRSVQSRQAGRQAGHDTT